uniref:Uncharacterized protein n=1 Tax=Chromera velia CCMP2878 TaxID=1169474 RepID=A0A0G4F696_9ALVE|eukprot:Cvel_15269.t1-p1 / transcript=Cvel_15269.t1 / gene=Cvel_15269 / organism=Chromera_velia_CCMP2878 / gene_product=hypothetical protein / transcript_product=hypothetical protein / location=Cvel_scaffold1119:50784-51467(+) / protein_length=228 / sequence_SO=supercontig / SO=protein_coding / is_pseudo=false
MTSSSFPLSASGVRTQEDAIVAVAHVIIHKLKRSIYGGFARDWVVGGGAQNGRPVNDIDVILDDRDDSQAQAQVTALTQHLAPLQFVLTSNTPASGGAVANKVRLTHRPTGFGVEVEFTHPARRRQISTSPGVEHSASNLMISTKGLDTFVKKGPNGRPLLDTATSARHAKDKMFVFYYKPEGRMPQERLRRIFQKGWKCLNQLPPQLVPNPSQHQPQAQYNVNWWEY